MRLPVTTWMSDGWIKSELEKHLWGYQNISMPWFWGYPKCITGIEKLVCQQTIKDIWQGQIIISKK